MKSTKRIRTLIPLAILVIGGIAFVIHSGFGTLSALGWRDISVICPIGALTTMLASKTIIPRAVISLVITVIAVLLIGRAVCAWICPVPVISSLRDIFKSRNKEGDEKALGEASEAGSAATAATAAAKELTAKEKKMLKTGCAGCAGHAASNSRHLVLGSALLSAAIFGFPVFCLVCPIGLAFAFVFILIMLFGGGDVTWSVIAVPALLLVEVVFFRKWCSNICPVSAFMSLVSKGNKTWQVTIDDDKCVETAHGHDCGRCAQVCEVGIDPRHPQLGTNFSECTKCRECLEHCPGQAITMPFIAPNSQMKVQAQMRKSLVAADGVAVSDAGSNSSGKG